jgi:hypothetical protein
MREGSAKELYERGVQEEQAGQLDEAMLCYRRALQIDATWADAWVNLGRILDDQRDWDEALACYERAVALPDGGQDPIAWSNRGNTLMSLARLEDALQSFDRALALAPSDPHARLGRRTTLGWAGRLAESNAARNPADPRDPGEVRERRRAVGEREVVARYFVGRHSRPELLDREAEVLVTGCASLAGRPPGLADGVRIQWGWSNLRIRERGRELILCEPDFREAPFEDTVWDVSFTLQTLVMHRMTSDLAGVEPVDCWMQDWLVVSPEALGAHTLVLRRLGGRDAEGGSGWVAGPNDTAEGLGRLRTGELARLRPALIKVLLLPPGFVVRFEGHAVVSMIGPDGRERWT